MFIFFINVPSAPQPPGSAPPPPPARNTSRQSGKGAAATLPLPKFLRGPSFSSSSSSSQQQGGGGGSRKAHTVRAVRYGRSYSMDLTRTFDSFDSSCDACVFEASAAAHAAAAAAAASEHGGSDPSGLAGSITGSSCLACDLEAASLDGALEPAAAAEFSGEAVLSRGQASALSHYADADEHTVSCFTACAPRSRRSSTKAKRRAKSLNSQHHHQMDTIDSDGEHEVALAM